MQPTLETLPSKVDQETQQVIKLFADASESVIDIQDNKGFASFLEMHNIPYDDTLEEYWDAVQVVGNRLIELKQVMTEDGTTDAFKLAVGAPNVMFKELALAANEEQFKKTKKDIFDQKTRSEYVEVAGKFNDDIRDFVSHRLDLNISTFTKLLTEAAEVGIAPEFVRKSAEITKQVVLGIRTELGFEQKMQAAGVQFRRGTPEEDAKGIDYVVEGVPIDVKSSLHKLLETGTPNESRPYFIKNGKVTLFPYDYDTDYQNNTFRIKQDVLELRAEQLKRDLDDMRVALRL